MIKKDLDRIILIKQRKRNKGTRAKRILQRKLGNWKEKVTNVKTATDEEKNIIANIFMKEKKTIMNSY